MTKIPQLRTLASSPPNLESRCPACFMSFAKKELSQWDGWNSPVI